MAMMRPTTQNGMLIQKLYDASAPGTGHTDQVMKTDHHRQVAFCTKAPPMRGPKTVPKAHAARTIEKYFGRWRRGTISAYMTCDRVITPPPPIP